MIWSKITWYIHVSSPGWRNANPTLGRTPEKQTDSYCYCSEDMNIYSIPKQNCMSKISGTFWAFPRDHEQIDNPKEASNDKMENTKVSFTAVLSPTTLKFDILKKSFFTQPWSKNSKYYTSHVLFSFTLAIFFLKYCVDMIGLVCWLIKFFLVKLHCLNHVHGTPLPFLTLDAKWLRNTHVISKIF